MLRLGRRLLFLWLALATLWLLVVSIPACLAIVTADHVAAVIAHMLPVALLPPVGLLLLGYGVRWALHCLWRP